MANIHRPELHSIIHAVKNGRENKRPKIDTITDLDDDEWESSSTSSGSDGEYSVYTDEEDDEEFILD